MYSKFPSRIIGSLPPVSLTLFSLSLLLAAPISAKAAFGLSRTEQGKDFTALMTKGKLEADLGNFERASDAFQSIADDEMAPTALRWEALVRYGLARSAAGDIRSGTEAFRTVLAKYSEKPEAVRFLTYAVASGIAGKVWLDFKAEFERLLKSAQVVSTEPIGMAANGPRIVNLKKQEIELKAIWKPFDPSLQRQRYHAEVVAYELDKILQLDMVPPAVNRNIEGRPGALQLWVYGCKVYQDVLSQSPGTTEWKREVSRTKTFDNLIGNRDRNATNILIDPNWGIVLIDHSHGFSNAEALQELPDKFDRQLIAKLRNLSKTGLQVRFEGVLEKRNIENLLKRRDQILGHVERLITEKGEAAVFY
jgi:hypothetical protein